MKKLSTGSLKFDPKSILKKSLFCRSTVTLAGSLGVAAEEVLYNIVPSLLVSFPYLLIILLHSWRFAPEWV